jgi:hypothetical protein
MSRRSLERGEAKVACCDIVTFEQRVIGVCEEGGHLTGSEGFARRDLGGSSGHCH